MESIKTLLEGVPSITYRIFIGLMLSAAFSIPLKAQALFESEQPLRLTLQADLSVLQNDISDDPEYIAGKLIEYLPANKINMFEVKVKPRGTTRRITGLCEFPPLKINFKKSQIANTTFEGNDKVKLVLQCREDQDFNNYVFEEYLIYKAYNLITDESYRVRLITLTIKDTGYNSPDLTMDGFIIEDDDTFAKRTGTKVYEKVVHHQDSCEAASVDRMAMFQYMIGNTDWYINTRHNISIFQRKEGGSLIAVPYDFDFAGVINTVYATTSKEIPITKVIDRYYKGSCRDPQALDETVQLFIEKRVDIIKLYEDFNLVPDYVTKKGVKYYAKFYKIINDSDQVQTSLSVCNRPAFSARRK
jgi:hypothetical protein